MLLLQARYEWQVHERTGYIVNICIKDDLCKLSIED